MEYSPAIEKELSKQKITVGHRVAVEREGRRYEGVLMPNTGDSAHLVVKLDSGYNAGVAWPAKIKKLRGEERRKAPAKKRYKPDPGRKDVVIIHTGGTIASRIDYETGAVRPALTPEELAEAVPELADIVNIRTDLLFQVYSEDMEPEHWIALARSAAQHIEKGAGGIIITHGTDTMHYTAAAMALMLQNASAPVLLVGAQRSSDRGSSDAALNLVCAANFIAKSSFHGVAICMHSSTSDDACFVLDPLNVKKMHTTRRDAFRPIDVKPYALVRRDGTIEKLSDWPRGEQRLAPHFEKRVALVKLHPGFSAEQLSAYEGYKGIVLEGTGMGHAPINELDAYTKKHPALLKQIERMAKAGVVIAMCSQCAYGRVNMNVYSPGRVLQDAGVVSTRMTPEAAFVKLGWLLGQTSDKKEVREAMAKSIAGEVVERIEPETFLY